MDNDNAVRDWIRTLLTVEAGVVAAVWSVLSFKQSIPSYKILILLIVVFGITAGFSLLQLIKRMRRWQSWFVRVSQRLQTLAPFYSREHGDVRIYPTYGTESNAHVLNRSPGAMYRWIQIPSLLFAVVAVIAVIAILFSRPESEHFASTIVVTTNSSSSMLSVADLVDLPLLASELTKPTNMVSSNLMSMLSTATLKALKNVQSVNTDQAALRISLVSALNDAIRGSSLYEVGRFAGVTLRQETQQLLAQNPEGPALVRLNRLLLEDAYPHGLSSNANSRQEVQVTVMRQAFDGKKVAPSSTHDIVMPLKDYNFLIDVLGALAKTNSFSSPIQITISSNVQMSADLTVKNPPTVIITNIHQPP
jgi:hypothetical protein